MENLLVMKFGGTSMGSAERIRASAHLVAAQYPSRPVAVVVSAMSKVTDLLLDTLRKAEAGDQTDMEANLHQLLTRHTECCTKLLPPERHTYALTGIEALVQEFTRIAKGILMLGERPP